MKAIKMEVGKKAEVVEWNGSFKQIENEINLKPNGCLGHTMLMRDNLIMWLDDCGKMYDNPLPFNRKLWHNDYVAGNCYITAFDDDGNDRDINDEEIDYIMSEYGEPQTDVEKLQSKPLMSYLFC